MGGSTSRLSSPTSTSRFIIHPSSAPAFVQNMVVMRHADRLDSVVPDWALTASRPWDTPLTDAGKARARDAGREIMGLGFPVHRVVVSPFRRCLETAAEVVLALCEVDGEGEGVPPIDPSRDKALSPDLSEVSVEYGLCEILGRRAIRPKFSPKNKKWFPHTSELEAVLPLGTVDNSTESIHKKLPRWEESKEKARKRYKEVICSLADKFPNENLLLITHGEGIGVSVSGFRKDIHVTHVNYCAYSHLQRQISYSPRGCKAQKFKVLTENNKTGVSYTTLE